MAKMQWTKEMEKMVMDADVEIEGTRVLYYNDNGEVATDKLKELTKAVGAKASIICGCRAVMHKCRRLRKDTTVTGKRKRKVEAQEPAQPVAAQEPVPRPVTGGKCPGKLEMQHANYSINHFSDEPEPRPVTAGKGVPTMRTGWLRSGQSMPKRLLVTLHHAEEVEQGEQVFTKDKDEESPGDVMPQVPASMDYDEEEEQPQAKKSHYTKEYEQELIEFMQTRTRQMPQSNGAAAAFEIEVINDVQEAQQLPVADAALPSNEADMEIELLNSSEMVAAADKFQDDVDDWMENTDMNTPFDRFLEDKQDSQMMVRNATESKDNECDDGLYTAEELNRIMTVLAEYRPTKTYEEQMHEWLAASRQPQISPSNGAAATYASAEEDEQLIQQLVTASNEAAPRVMSPSNGAAATAATAAPAGPWMLDVEDITLEYMSKIFRVDKSDIPPEPLNKAKLTLEGLIEMEKQRVISVTFGAERSIFGMSTIVVNDQDRWIEVMTRQAKKYTKDIHREKKNYQAAIYHILNMLGFSTERKDINEVAWLQYGKEKKAYVPQCLEVLR